MITNECGQAAKELDVIFMNCSDEILCKIPDEFREYISSIADKDYNFEYDNSKSLDEQDILPRTRRFIAFVYKEYVCNDGQKYVYEKELENAFAQIEYKKECEYNVDKAFEKNASRVDKGGKHQLEKVDDKSFLFKLFSKIKGFLRKKKQY